MRGPSHHRDDRADAMAYAIAPIPRAGKQSKRHSIVEALTNSVSGIATGYLSNVFILPVITGHAVDWTTGWVITAVFTAISIVRSYIVRRTFNWWNHR